MLASPPACPDTSAHAGRDARYDRAFRAALACAAAVVLVALDGAALSMAWGGRVAWDAFGWRFFTSDAWDVGAGRFGALVPVFGTLVSSAVAMLIAVPVSFGIAVFLTEVAPTRLRTPLASALELLAEVVDEDEREIDKQRGQQRPGGVEQNAVLREEVPRAAGQHGGDSNAERQHGGGAEHRAEGDDGQPHQHRRR